MAAALAPMRMPGEHRLAEAWRFGSRPDDFTIPSLAERAVSLSSVPEAERV